MAWKWPSATKGASNEEWTGFIDQGVTLEGTLTVTGTFRIDGNVKGNIISEQTVILGDGAKVEGQIEGNRVVISGRFHCLTFAAGGATGCMESRRAERRRRHIVAMLKHYTSGLAHMVQ